MAKVLLVGYIVELLQERERTLQDAGYQVTVALSFATAATAKNVAVDAQTGAVWSTYTDGKSSYAKSWLPQK